MWNSFTSRAARGSEERSPQTHSANCSRIWRPDGSFPGAGHESYPHAPSSLEGK